MTLRTLFAELIEDLQEKFDGSLLLSMSEEDVIGKIIDVLGGGMEDELIRVELYLLTELLLLEAELVEGQRLYLMEIHKRMLVKDRNDSIYSEEMIFFELTPVLPNYLFELIDDITRDLPSRYFLDNHLKYLKAIQIMLIIRLIDILKANQDPSIGMQPVPAIDIKFL